MPKKVKTKYTIRPDGRIVLTETIDGKRKYFYGSTDAECEKKRDAYITSLKQLESEGVKFSEVCEDWWESFEPKLSPNSVMTYKGAKNRALEHFGEKGIKVISQRDIFSYLQYFAAQKMSQKVISRHKSVLLSIFDYAFAQGYVDINPVSGIPQVKGKQRVMREPATDEDIRLINEHKMDEPYGRMMFFMLYTGCRRGEAAALQYKHINRQQKTAAIVQSLAFSEGGQPIIKQPKTVAGVRQVILTDDILAVIGDGKPNEYVFFGSELPKQHALEYGLKHFQNSHGITSTAHQLRHSYASMLYSGGFGIQDAKFLLGHRDTRTTQDIYTHLEQSHAMEIGNDVRNYIGNRCQQSCQKSAKP